MVELTPRDVRAHATATGPHPRPGRRRLRAGLAVGAAFLVGSSLALWSPISGAATSGAANPSGVLKYGVDLNDTFSNTFDPGASTDDCSYQVYSGLFDSMLSPSNTKVNPLLAASYTATPSSITFHLQPGATFSNGNPVTAATVAASIDHIKASPFRFSLTYIQSVQQVDPQTITLSLNKPVAGDVLWAMTYIDGMQLDPSALPTTNAVPASSGPFTLSKYQQGSSILLKANPTYWDKSAYKLGGVNFVQVSPGPQEISALETGAVDMLPIQPEDYAAVKALPNVSLATTKSEDYLVMQTRQSQAPFNDPKVRAAMEYAVDRNAINKAVFLGLGQPAFQPFPDWTAGYNKSVGTKYTYQPKKAKALLAAAGHPNGVSFTLVIPSGSATFNRTSQILQAEMAAAGFKMNIQQVNPTDLFTDVYEHGQGDAVLTEELTNGPDLANNFEAEYTGIGFAGKELGDTNATITPLVDQALTSLSPSVQGPPMRQASSIVMSTGTEVPLIFEPSVVAYNKDRVGGKVVAPIGECRSNLAGIYIKKG